jgi:hypothetical protein
MVATLSHLSIMQVGVMWHVECGDGIVFPFSRGCSFITLTADGRKIATVSGDGWCLGRCPDGLLEHM